VIKFQRLTRNPGNNAVNRSKKYLFRDARCLGRSCFRPEERTIPVKPYAFYGQNLRSKPRQTWVCGHRSDFGCPLLDDYTPELAEERIADGWQSVRIV